MHTMNERERAVDPVEGRRIIVTGAAGGIGSGVLAGLASRGAKLGAIYNRTPPAEDLRALATWRQCELDNKAKVEACFTSIADELGGLDALINVAGLWRGGPADTADDEQIDFLISANLKTVVFTNQAAFALMKDKGGRIVNFGSVEGIEGNVESPIYAAAKAAVHGWTRSAALSWGSAGVTVNAVAPVMHTPVYSRIRTLMSAEELHEHDKEMARRIVIGGKLGDAEKDCTPLLAFLASEGSRFVTGQLLAVDGGLHMMGA
jgi:NAD(P)-dependent dehydrogenase (short-subunit alcohol dehydrogenase family)